MMVATHLARTLMLALALTSVIGTHYDGYMHLDGLQVRPEGSDSILFAMPDGVANTDKDSLMPLCEGYGMDCWSFTETYNHLYRAPTSNSSIDTYVSNTGCGTLPGFAIVNGSCGGCGTRGAGCDSPDIRYMTCTGTDFNIDPLHQYDSVSEDACKLICDEDPDCTVFVTTKTGHPRVAPFGSCETFKWHHDSSHPSATGYLCMNHVPQSPNKRTTDNTAGTLARAARRARTNGAFDGYHHLDGLQFFEPDGDGSALANIKKGDADGNALPIGSGTTSLMATCDQDDSCSAFRMDAFLTLLYNKPFANATIDTYFSTTTCGDGQTPTVVPGSCGHESTIQYMVCQGRTFEVEFLDRYADDPEGCATKCNNNPKCSVFVATKDRQYCELYNWYSSGQGSSIDNNPSYLKISAL